MKPSLVSVCLSLSLVSLASSGCQGPTVKIATEPIEIRIDLHHEVRVTLEGDLGKTLASERGEAALSTRSVDATLSQRLARAKQAGAVGERADGYLDVTPRSVAPTDRALVDEVNSGRRSDYTQLASRRGAPQGQVERLAGATRLSAAGSGEAIQTPDGEWLIKAADTHVEIVAPSDAQEEGR